MNLNLDFGPESQQLGRGQLLVDADAELRVRIGARRDKRSRGRLGGGRNRPRFIGARLLIEAETRTERNLLEVAQEDRHRVDRH